MASTSSRTIGIKLKSKCHKTIYSQEIGLKNFDVFSERERLVLTSRLKSKKYQIYVITTNELISSDMQWCKENVQIHSNYTRNHIKV